MTTELDPIDEAALLMLRGLVARIESGEAVVVVCKAKDTEDKQRLVVEWAESPLARAAAKLSDAEAKVLRLAENDLCPDCRKGKLADLMGGELVCGNCEAHFPIG